MFGDPVIGTMLVMLVVQSIMLLLRRAFVEHNEEPESELTGEERVLNMIRQDYENDKLSTLELEWATKRALEGKGYQACVQGLGQPTFSAALEAKGYAVLTEAQYKKAAEEVKALEAKVNSG
jgi:hypothetical protein